MTARIAILFDNAVHPETTGAYCLRALESLDRDGHIAAVEHVLPGDLPRLAADRDPWDLILAIDDGLTCDLPPGLPPVAWWVIDTQGDYHRCLSRARQSRWTFAAQRHDVERLQRDGIAATWLPLACDPERHGRQQVDLKYDVCFVGRLQPGERTRLIQKLSLDASRVFVSQSESTVLAPAFSAARIVFHRGHAHDISPRVFEALASGSLLITNDQRDNGLSTLFQDGRHLGTYGDDAELVEKLG